MTYALVRAWALSGKPLAFWALAVAVAGILAAPTGADAKTPGKTYCFNGVCHAVKTLDETRNLVGRTTSVVASYYDDPKRDRFNPSNLTSSGEYFRAWAPDNAASPILPNGTKVVVWHPTTKKAVMVRINNAGPYYGNRTLDLSRGAAEKIGLNGSGVKRIQMAVVAAPTREEATYKKGRTYAPVRGFIGQYASLDAAVASVTGVSKPTLVADALLQANKKPTGKLASNRVGAKPAAKKTASLIPDQALKASGITSTGHKQPATGPTRLAAAEPMARARPHE